MRFEDQNDLTERDHMRESGVLVGVLILIVQSRDHDSQCLWQDNQRESLVRGESK